MHREAPGADALAIPQRFALARIYCGASAQTIKLDFMAATPGRWHRTPPAIFPPLLGLFGLGLGWRRASEVLGVPGAAGELLLGAVSLLFVAGIIAYLGKFLQRPGALVDDLKIISGRAGISAVSMSTMLFAAVLVPYAPGMAKLVLIVGLAAHLAVILIVVAVLWSAPYVQRRMTPVWHLTFVGVIVAPIGAVPLGWTGLAELILFVSTATAATILTGNLIGMTKAAIPPPLRPTLAIHLAPVALLGTAASLLGLHALALAFGLGAIALMALLLARTRYLTAAGFTPFWGAFTFPMASFVGLMLLLAQAHGGVFRLLAAVALIGATLAIPPIAFRIIKMWLAGSLAAKTNASKA